MTDEVEVKKPKNPDYSDSALKLKNAPEVRGLFQEWVAAQKLAGEADAVMMKEVDALPSTKAEREARAKAKDARTVLEGAIVEYGSYQDVEQGLYAILQERKLITYDPEKIRKFIPEYADKILVEVDASRLKGFLKGGLVTPEQVAKCAEVKKSNRFVIEVRG